MNASRVYFACRTFQSLSTGDMVDEVRVFTTWAAADSVFTEWVSDSNNENVWADMTTLEF